MHRYASVIGGKTNSMIIKHASSLFGRTFSSFLLETSRKFPTTVMEQPRAKCARATFLKKTDLQANTRATCAIVCTRYFENDYSLYTL